MERIKRGLAVLLAMLMLTSAFAVNVAAESPEIEEPDEPMLQGSSENVTLEESVEQVVEVISEDVNVEIEPEQENEPVDEVIYNIGDMDIVVGWDEELAQSEELEYLYYLFNEDGSYTIEIFDENPFFPYEVQFTYNGETTTEWFMDPDDSVEIGGHAFYIYPHFEPQSIGFWVGGKYVPAYPEPKTFTSAPGIAMWSLQPLKEKYFTVDLSMFFREELKGITPEILLAFAGEDISDETAVVWAKQNDDDNFTIINTDSTIDIEPAYIGGSYARLELIVGTADQLDTNNVRYILTVNLSRDSSLIKFSAFTEEKEEITVFGADPVYSGTTLGLSFYRVAVDAEDWTEGKAYIKMSLGDEIIEADLSVTVYKGRHDSEEAAVEAGAEDITNQIWDTAGDGYLADYSSFSYQNSPAFTLVLKRGGIVSGVLSFGVSMRATSYSFSYGSLYTEDADGNRNTVTDYSEFEDGVYVNTLKPGYPADEEYYYSFSVLGPGELYSNNYSEGGVHGINYVQKAVVGNYASLSEAEGQTDIKEELFSSSLTNGGYLADFSDGLEFTIFLKTGVIFHTTVKAVEADLPDASNPLSADTYFRMESASKAEGNTGSIISYVMDYEDDSYYYNGYQTVFILNSDKTPVTDTEIVPSFYTGNKVTVYAGHDGMSGTVQVSGKTAVPFESGKAIQYSAAAESGTHLKNYWVTFVTQQEGATLFVNGGTNSEHKDEETGLPVREVFLNEAYGNHHDIFFANIGDEEMTGLYVKLENAQNVQLDPYWTVGDTTSLAPFTKVRTEDADGIYVSYGELPNVAKIRLIPMTDEDGNELAGEISGTLIVGHDDEEVEIKLTGTAGTPRITTTEVVDGVQYVPYSSVIQTNNMYASDAVEFELVSGTLPDGMELKQDGELYGIPTVTGEFTIGVKASYDGFESSEATFTFTISDNTDTNVWNSTDTGYDISIAIINQDGTISHGFDDNDANIEEIESVLAGDNNWRDEYQIFESNGTFAYFIDLWLDGDKLTEGTDYTAEEGSTKITILNQTLRSKGAGTHTIAMEFREGDPVDGTLKRTAQNYTVTSSGSGTSSGGSGTTSRPSYSSGSSNKNSGTSTNTDVEETNTKAEMKFIDVTVADWFYEDVKWAFEEGYMVGISETIFAPNADISQATVVTVLARLANVDLSIYDGVTYDSIPEGTWYTNAAIWAKQAGLLPDHTDFKGEEVITRDEMAIMLVKFLKRMGVDCSEPESPAYFADADKMSDAGYNAFQILYKTGVFKGMGNNVMDPLGTTTRAQFSALINRVNSCIGA